MSEANFEVLLELSGLKKKRFAEMMGVAPTTIGNWCKAAPKYAVLALQLMVDLKAKEEELKRAYSIMAEYNEMKLHRKDIVKKAEALIEAASDKG